MFVRYLLLIQINPDAAGSTGPDERLAEEMGTLLEDMTKAAVTNRRPATRVAERLRRRGGSNGRGWLPG
jgi:hypothetical protein